MAEDGRSDAAGGASGADVEALVRAESVRALFARNATAQATVLLNSALVVVVLWDHAAPPVLLGWAGLLWAVAGARLALGAAYLRAGPTPAGAARWGARFTWGAAANGAIWGAVPLLVGAALPIAQLVFLAFVLGGMAAGAALSNATRPAAFLAFAVPALAPMAGVLGAGGDRLRVAMALLLASFGVAVWAISRSAGRAVADAIRLRFENAELARGLGALAAGLETRVAERTAQLEAARAREREAERQLAAGARLATLGALAGGVAHEINNPLGSVRANLGYLRDELPRAGSDPAARAELEQALAEAAEGVDRVSGFVRHLVALSRAEPPAALEPLDLHATLDESVERLRAELDPRAILRRAYGEVPAALGCRARLVQVFVNLLRNAAQALPEGERDRHEIRISTRHDPGGGWVVTEVSDTGCGIPAASLERIWDPFFTTRVGQASGLGLSICRSLVGALGGRIAARSREGEGSTFTVWLKVASQLPSRE
jgi:signal transduction histidine kinase